MHDEGYIKDTEWHYYLKDHLGNTRVDFVANGTSTSNVQDYHYYPFGMDFTGLNVISSDNKYKYNGKELQGDHGLDWYDYGARFYDAELAVFHTVDPLAEDYNYQSPYVYAANNPIRYIDWMGMGPTDDYFNKAGKYLGSDNAKTDNVQIISQGDWDKDKKVKSDGSESIDHNVGASKSKNITETTMTNDAVVSVVKHYDNQLDPTSKKENVDIIAKVLPKGVLMQSDVDKGSELFGVKMTSDTNDIQVNVNGGTVDKDLNTASNIKNSLVHEHQHQKDGLRYSSKRQRERRAIRAQKAHSTFGSTTEEFQQLVSDYEIFYRK